MLAGIPLYRLAYFPSPEPEDDGAEHNEMRDYFLALFMKHRVDVGPPPSRDNTDVAVVLHLNIALTASISR